MPCYILMETYCGLLALCERNPPANQHKVIVNGRRGSLVWFVEVNILPDWWRHDSRKKNWPSGRSHVNIFVKTDLISASERYIKSQLEKTRSMLKTIGLFIQDHLTQRHIWLSRLWPRPKKPLPKPRMTKIVNASFRDRLDIINVNSHKVSKSRGLYFKFSKNQNDTIIQITNLAEMFQ